MDAQYLYNNIQICSNVPQDLATVYFFSLNESVLNSLTPTRSTSRLLLFTKQLSASWTLIYCLSCNPVTRALHRIDSCTSLSLLKYRLLKIAQSVHPTNEELPCSIALHCNNTHLIFHTVFITLCNYLSFHQDFIILKTELSESPLLFYHNE